MKKHSQKSAISIVVLLLTVIIGYFIKNNTDTTIGNEAQVQHIIKPNSPLIYTKHARCRMQCRNISESEIREVLREGHVNFQKSDVTDKPCPSYAIEDKVKEGQHLRIVFGLCGDRIKVITCIDLDNEYDCHCD